MQAFEVGSLQL